MASLFVFLDESGNFDFSNGSGATEWLTLTSLVTTDPSECVMELYQTKHDLIATGHSMEFFHATEDKQEVRDKVFPVLAKLSCARVDSLAIRKRRLFPDWREKEEFYPRMLAYLLKYPFDPRGLDVSRFSSVVIFMDVVDATKRQRNSLVAGVKQFLKPRLGGVTYSIHMHRSASHLYLQAVDYFCWAMSVKRERGEVRPYQTIKGLVKSDFDIFENGNKDWY